MKKHRFHFIFLALILSQGIQATPPGWYDPVPVINNLEEFKIVSDSKKDVYIVYSRLLAPFKKENPQDFSIEMKLQGSRNQVVKISELKLKPYLVLFSLSPTIAVSNSQIMIVWQRPSDSNIGMTFEYILLDKNDLSVIKRSNIPLENTDAFTPSVFSDDKNIFHIFFQKRLNEGSTSLAHMVYEKNEFRQKGEVIKNNQSVGRGAFFPSIFFQDGTIHVVYQSRQSDTLTDELFYIYSKNSGESFSKPEAITQNQVNDFAPFIISNKQEMDLTWESNENGSWQIYYSKDLKEPEKITSSLSNCYQPVIGYARKNGKIFAWFDQRVNPPQVFAKFIDKPDSPMGKEHQVTFLKNSSFSPFLADSGNDLALFFLSNEVLYEMKVDETTSPIIVTSPTHPRNQVVASSDITLKWKVENEPSGIADYAYLIDSREDSDPDFFNLSGETNTLVKKGLSGGKFFFHIKYRDKAGNESKVFHYPFSVDSSSPVIAEIDSDTHKENVPEKNHEFRVKISAEDDIGVKGFNYTLSTNRGAPLDKFTEKTELSFPDLEDGSYYFLVQAVDFAGRTSPVTSYKINIVPEDYDDFILLSNISEGRVTQDYVEVTIQMNNPEKKLSDVYGLLSKKRQDPFEKGGKLEVKQIEGVYRIRVPIPTRKLELFTLSLGLSYEDGTKSFPRQLFFEHYDANYKEQIQISQIGRKITIVKLGDSPDIIEGIKPEIELVNDSGLYRVAFALPGKYSNEIEGFSYQVSDIPSLPEGKMNYVKEPVYLFDLQDGIYYISVKPVFKNKKANQYSNYSYLRFEVRSGSILNLKNALLALVFIVTLVLIFGRERLKFYLSRYK